MVQNTHFYKSVGDRGLSSGVCEDGEGMSKKGGNRGSKCSKEVLMGETRVMGKICAASWGVTREDKAPSLSLLSSSKMDPVFHQLESFIAG